MDRLHQAVGWDEHRYTAAENAALAVLASRGEVTAAELADAVPALREQIVTFPGRPYESRQRVCATVLGSLAAEGRVRRARPAGNWASAQLRCALAEPLPALPTAEAKAVLARPPSKPKPPASPPSSAQPASSPATDHPSNAGSPSN
ncbi:DNA glycosylase AlkZ-like family protein [Streptomyces flavidovirens]|uniref:DNA glycosylase AlkZ-like family protein n=1 Tax=Streptomyces flavidovirens TaxID=67298 RepID=A0ABW6RF31_9ACTN